MADMLKISEAASMGMHAMVLLAAKPERRLTAGEIAGELHVSGAHLSKVLQRLAKARLVASTRGPKGGFALAKDGRRVTLLDVYEAVEGPLGRSECLLGLPRCNAKRCIMGDVVGAVTTRVREYLAKTRLSTLNDVFGS